MRFDIGNVVRPVDQTDFSDLTTATRKGAATWQDDGSLEIPFSRTLTDDEVAAITIRLSTADDEQEQARWAVQAALAVNEAYLALPSPKTSTQVEAQVDALTRQHQAWFRLAGVRGDEL